MDVVLEVFDTFFFDRIYANVLPAHTSFTTFDPITTIAAGLKGIGSDNATWAAQTAGELLRKSAWSFQPSSQYLSFEPSEYAYMSRWNRDNVFRQTVSLFLITWLFGAVIYFGFASLSYIFIFDKTTFQHPKYLRNQMRLEIQQATTALPLIAVLTVPFFVAEVRGHSYIYDKINAVESDHPAVRLFGNSWNWLQFPVFLLFTDFFIYWIHRGLHHPRVYKHLHKPHHKWIMPTPFASHAFHPVDGFAQSLPYHIFPFILPLQKFAYICLFAFINIWSVLIHDGEYVANSPIINGAACHTMHHLYFNYNYGQFTTLWDRLGGSYRKPNDELFKRETKMAADEWNRQAKEMEKIVTQVEGSDERSYGPEDETVKKVQ